MALVAGQAFAQPLVGPAVGNADTLVSEGSKLFNRKQYPKAAEAFLRATRVNPAQLGTYVQLARAALLAKQPQRACYAYRVYLKASSDSPERKKAQAEGDQCERQLKAMKKPPVDLGPKYVELRASFFSTLDRGEVLGAGGAAELLRTLVNEGFLGPELGEMAQRLGGAAVAAADQIHARALANERMTSEVLKSARPLYQVAGDVGASPADAKSRMAFLDGLAELQAKEYRKAEASFVEAARGDPKNREYQFYKALALFQAGERPAALKVLEGELKNDPRTAVLRSALAVGHAPDFGAAELERLLFNSRFPPEK